MQSTNEPVIGYGLWVIGYGKVKYFIYVYC